jgi:hypothetical protein
MMPMAWEQKVINKLEALGFSSQEIDRFRREGFDPEDIIRLEADPRMVNSQGLRRQINKDLMFLIFAAEDNDWDVVDHFAAELMWRLVWAMTVGWGNKAPGILKVIGSATALRDASARRDRALKAIEAGLRHEKRNWKAHCTDTKRVNMVLDMYEKMYTYGLSRKDALVKIGKGETSVNPYTKSVLRRVIRGEFGETPPQDFVDAVSAKSKPQKRSRQLARSTDVRRKKR